MMLVILQSLVLLHLFHRSGCLRFNCFPWHFGVSISFLSFAANACSSAHVCSSPPSMSFLQSQNAVCEQCLILDLLFLHHWALHTAPLLPLLAPLWRRAHVQLLFSFLALLAGSKTFRSAALRICIALVCHLVTMSFRGPFLSHSSILQSTAFYWEC